MRDKFINFMLLALGFGFASFILIHLVLIWFYEQVIIYEPNIFILLQEIVLMSLIVALYVRQLKRFTN